MLASHSSIGAHGPRMRELMLLVSCVQFTYSVILDVVMSVRSQEAVDRFFQNIERLIPGGHNVPLMIPGTPYYKGMKVRVQIQCMSLSSHDAWFQVDLEEGPRRVPTWDLLCF